MSKPFRINIENNIAEMILDKPPVNAFNSQGWADIASEIETLGNTEAALHTHIFPRFMNEEPELRAGPAWFYDWQNAPKFHAETYGSLMQQIRESLTRREVVVT